MGRYLVQTSVGWVSIFEHTIVHTSIGSFGKKKKEKLAWYY